MKGLYQALVKYADIAGVVEKPHHNEAKFHWQLDLNLDGSLAADVLTPLTTPRLVGKKERIDSFAVRVVPRTTRTSGVSPMLASDDIAYVLGWVETPDRQPGESEEDWAKAQRKREISSRERHATWRQLTEEWAEFARAQDDPIPHALLRFLDNHVHEVQRPEQWSSKDGVFVRVAGVAASESPTAARFWSQRIDAKKAATQGLCLICGRYGSLVETFPAQVKGPLIPQGQSSGVAPISINEFAYGYGLRKGLGQVPVCVQCSLAAIGALNKLLSDDEHRSWNSESVTIWWVEEPQQHNHALIIDEAKPEQIVELIETVESGKKHPGTLDLAEFHSLTLQGNASRMMVRDWTHMPVEELQRNIAQWFRDTEIAPMWATDPRHSPLWRLAQSTGRYDKSKNQYLRATDPAGRHPHLIADVLRETALRNHPLPRHIAAHLVQRIAADGRIDGTRAAILRLHLNRGLHQKGTIMPGLDTTNTEPCYLLGRLLSVYEDTQYAAARSDGGDPPNATFADKYLAGAITSPRLVLTAGAKQASAWLAKLRKSKRDYYLRKQIDEIIALISVDNPGPLNASIDEQALFVLGYHHQRANSNAQRQTALERKSSGETTDPQEPFDETQQGAEK